MIKNNCVITIDPGMGGTGYAVWQADEKTWKQCVPPVDWGILHPKGKTYEERRVNLSLQFSELLKEWMPGRVVCEKPQFFSSAGGHMCAATGDLVTLVLVVGAFAGICDLKDIGYEMVPVNTWKGQLSKAAVRSRLQSRFGKREASKFKSHEEDAVGLGLYMKGML